MINTTTFSFLNDLEKNNNRDWFNENKNLYTESQQNVLDFVEALIYEMGKFDDNVVKLDPKKTLFRIYRDTRFSKDKSPYKTNFGASFLGMGKAIGLGGYYLHLQPKQCFLAGGVYMTEPKNLKIIRQEISENSADFLKIINDENFKKHFTFEGEKLARVPQGFEKEDAMAEYLKYKNYAIMHLLKDDEVLDKNAVKNFAKIFEAMKPFVDFLNAPFV